MKNATSSKNRSLTIFFLLTFIFALPIYILVGLASENVIFSPEIAFAFVPLAALVPIGGASILTFKESGWAGVKALLRRSYDCCFKSLDIDHRCNSHLLMGT